MNYSWESSRAGQCAPQGRANTPQVSICIPAFQAERYLQETLDSVATQTFRDWELIVVEDGSNDRTEEIVRNFAANATERIYFERHAENRGLPATRNTGLSRARAKLVALLDADDYWDSSHLELLMAEISSKEVDLVHSGSVLFDSDTRRTLELRRPSPEVVRTFPLSLFEANYVIQPASVMLTRRLWERVGGFNESFRYVEDREMWLRCARAGAKFSFTGRDTCFYRKHSSALSTHAAEMAIASALVFEQHLDWLEIPKALRVQRATGAWVAAARIAQRSAPKRACELLLRAQRIAPRLDRFLWSWALRLYSLLTGK